MIEEAFRQPVPAGVKRCLRCGTHLKWREGVWLAHPGSTSRKDDEIVCFQIARSRAELATRTPVHHG